jgi:hypothetical protein
MTAATPILVLGAGHRCGSTLLQRLLCSHPDVYIWGEHEGQLGPLLELGAELREWSDTLGRRGRDLFAEGGYQSFMANVLPETGHVDDALRAFVLRLFADTAAARGRRIWGFKEIRYTLAQAEALYRLFPDLAVVYIVRDPRDILRSLDDWERQGQWFTRRLTEYAIGFWHRVADSFLAADPGGPMPVLRLRYEDVVADPWKAAGQLAEHTGLDADRLDMTVFDHRIPGGPPREGRVPRPWEELPAEMRALLETEDSRRIAAAYGYQL